MRGPGDLKSSANAGEMSQDLKGKVSIKQYYNGALAMKNVEPVPQSGFALMPGTKMVGVAVSAQCRKGVLLVDANLSYVLSFMVGSITIFRNATVPVATIAAAWVTAEILPDLSFFGEANTFGVWHPDIETRRIFRDPSDDTVWTVDLWPYVDIPGADLGDTYTTTDDYWSLYIRWSAGASALAINVTIEGNTTTAVRLVDGGGALVTPDAAIGANWTNLATLLRPLIRALPGMNADVDIQYDVAQDASRYRVFNIVFSGSLSGSEYQVDAQIVNTSDASIIASHVEIGKTDLEPLVSTARGWFSGMDVFQDRSIYYAPKAKRAALASSKVGEYFNLNIKDQADNSARLEALRTITSETILHVIEGKYLLVFTDQGEWFLSNRTIARNEPMNFVRASENGTRPNCRPAAFEGRVWYVNPDGSMLFSSNYDDVSTSYFSDPEHLLATHLIQGVKRMWVQKKVGQNNASRLWMLRDDGRMVCAIVIKAQEIMAVVEWVPAAGGLVREFVVDGQQRVMLTVQRGSLVTEEVMEEAQDNVFQCAIEITTDLTGRASGLSTLEGRTVWARLGGRILGPFTVTGGAIDTDEPLVSGLAGLWQAPLFESMPFVRVLPNNEILQRPGRVHTVNLHLIETESVAVGANGKPARNVALQAQSDDLSAAPVPFTGKRPVMGLNGATEGPTVRITQLRPGQLRLRDYLVGAKL